MHTLLTQLDSESVRRIRIDLMQLHSRLSEVESGLSSEVIPDRVSITSLREKTLSLLTALRNL